MAGRLLILGAGGHGRAVADLALECGFTVAGFTDRVPGPEVLGGDDGVATLASDGKIDGAVVGVGNTALARRAELFSMLRSLRVATPTLIHPRACVSRSCKLGAGVVAFPNVVLYSGVIAEHDCRVADHAYLSPGVILAGGVTVEAGAFLGMGALVVPGVTVRTGARVKAGAVVVSSPEGIQRA